MTTNTPGYPGWNGQSEAGKWSFPFWHSRTGFTQIYVRSRGTDDPPARIWRTVRARCVCSLEIPLPSWTVWGKTYAVVSASLIPDRVTTNRTYTRLTQTCQVWGGSGEREANDGEKGDQSTTRGTTYRFHGCEKLTQTRRKNRNNSPSPD